MLLLIVFEDGMCLIVINQLLNCIKHLLTDQALATFNVDLKVARLVSSVDCDR